MPGLKQNSIIYKRPNICIILKFLSSQSLNYSMQCFNFELATLKQWRFKNAYASRQNFPSVSIQFGENLDLEKIVCLCSYDFYLFHKPFGATKPDVYSDIVRRYGGVNGNEIYDKYFFIWRPYLICYEWSEDLQLWNLYVCIINLVSGRRSRIG